MGNGATLAAELILFCYEILKYDMRDVLILALSPCYILIYMF